MLTADTLLHPITGPPGSRMAKLLGAGLEPVAGLRGPTGCSGRIVADVSGGRADLAACAAGLPGGAALPEALAVRLARRGARFRWGEPVILPDVESLIALCRARGHSSVEIARADPSLLSGMQIGAWFDAHWRMRALRRLVLPSGVARSRYPALLSRRWLLAMADIAFWAGVHERLTPAERQRLTASSYVALLYHRFAGQLHPGQERIDIAAERFGRQLWALRLMGFRPLGGEEIIGFHTGVLNAVPARSLAITVDDASADCVAPLLRHAGWMPQLFVSTRELGQAAQWLDGAPLATWGELSTLAARGVAIGSHAQHHRRLTTLSAADQRQELIGSRADLARRLPAPLDIVAFPHGDHDATVCEAAQAAGFRAGLTTSKGRNGAATDPYRVRRVSVHGHDGVLAVLWKAVTGEDLPAPWRALRAVRLWCRHRVRRR